MTEAKHPESITQIELNDKLNSDFEDFSEEFDKRFVVLLKLIYTYVLYDDDKNRFYVRQGQEQKTGESGHLFNKKNYNTWDKSNQTIGRLTF